MDAISPEYWVQAKSQHKHFIRFFVLKGPIQKRTRALAQRYIVAPGADISLSFDTHSNFPWELAKQSFREVPKSD